MSKLRTVGIVLYDEVEVMDFAGPFEVFSTASRMSEGARPFEVSTVAREPRVRARGGLVVMPTATLEERSSFDVLLIPGGVVDAELERSDVLDWIERASRTAEITASICTGAFFLTRLGLLDGLRVTTHWEDADALEKAWPQLRVDRDARFIDNGRIVTSAGISAGIDMALHLVARLEGEALAIKTARQMDYAWRREGS